MSTEFEEFTFMTPPWNQSILKKHGWITHLMEKIHNLLHSSGPIALQLIGYLAYGCKISTFTQYNSTMRNCHCGQ